MAGYLKTQNPYECSGCGACASSCPKSCIKLVARDDGFVYPEVEKEKCISCHLCERTCPYETTAIFNQPQGYFAVVAKDSEVLKKSSSGGVFGLIAKHVLQTGGIVYGAAFDENFQCHHIGVGDDDSLEKLKKSKYVQSRADRFFGDVRAQLKAGKTVLFTGTPCQVAGLINYVGGERQNLYTVDIACHGVPSQKDFDQFVRHLEDKHNGKLERIDFRHKRPGKWNHYLSYMVSGKTYQNEPYQALYYYLFLHGQNFRKSCYQCPYAQMGRVGDITLADCWGLERGSVPFEINSGVSAVTINTDKGEELFNAIKGSVNSTPIEPDFLVKNNQPFRTPCSEPEARDKIIQDILKNGYSDSRDYLPKITYFKERVKAAIPSEVKNKIRKAAHSICK